MSNLPISSDTVSFPTALAPSVRSSVSPQATSTSDTNQITSQAVTGTADVPQSTPSALQQESPFASPADIAQALDEVQSAIKTITNELQFSIDDDTGKTVVKVVDTSTNEVIKQFPSEELLRISKALDKFQGLLLQQEA